MRHEIARQECDTLILLVGSNPLPNYLTATLLRPNKVVLIHTPETCKPAERLNFVLVNRAKIEMLRLAKASDAREIAEAIKRIMSESGPERVHLNYTGGTKIMAAHARMEFWKSGGKDQNASYLNDGEQRLFFDDGFSVKLEDKDLGLTLQLIGELHNCKIGTRSDKDEGEPTENDALAIAANGSDPRRSSGGRWLEVAVAAWIRDATGLTPSRGISWELEGRRFEIDVALVRSHRLYVISCTTASELRPCKSKLFEVALRARQLGGDLARSAVVSLIDGQDSKGRYIDQLRRDVESVWEAPNKPQAFGLADLREWTGAAGSPNLDTLTRWLNS